MSDATESPFDNSERMKERIYLSFTALAVLLSMRSHGPVAAGEALVTFTVTIAGMAVAIFVADMMAHLLRHRRLFRRAELRHAAEVSLGATGAVGLPFLFLVAAALGLWTVGTAVLAGCVALIAGLVVIGWLAAHRAHLPLWQRSVILLAEAGLAVLVVALEMLAHG